MRSTAQAHAHVIPAAQLRILEGQTHKVAAEATAALEAFFAM
jgi:hypothetical protein